MSYEYSDKSREGDAHALPDVDVFYANQKTCTEDVFGESFTTVGYYFAFGFPGCLWDSDPVGPFDTYGQALTEARELAGFCPHGIADDDSDDPLNVDPSCPQCASKAQRTS